MRLRVFALVACLTALPLSAAFAQDIPEPRGVDMGPSPTVGDPPPSTEHTGSDNSALGSAAAAAASDDERDQNEVGSEFDGSGSHNDDPDKPGGTHVESNGDP